MADYASLIPINVITGFLGSGKTTVLQRLLRSPALRDTAVLVNEFGEVGLDHHLIGHAAESTVLLENGCLCCTIRGDLQAGLRDLLSRRDRGEIARLGRVVIETSGLADPVPIAYTVLAEPVIQHHFRLANVITAVDAVNGAGQLARFPESVKQVAVADRLVLTKTDICPAERAAALRAELTRLNPSAPVFESAAGALDPERLLTEDAYGPGGRRDEADRWRQGAAGGEDQVRRHDRHHGVSSFCVSFDTPLDWTAFGVWMTMLLHRHGENVLRVKGMLNVAGVVEPVLINGVQHIVHPPSHLESWPDADRRSRIVFIVRDIPRARIEASLAAFNALANPSDGAAPGTAADAVAGSTGVAARRL
jgi:G3E family GTPase